jgi:galactonate dehydratase
MEVLRVKVNARGNWVLVRLKAGGLSGIGDASHGRGDEATLALLRKLYPLIEGQPVSAIAAFVDKAGRIVEAEPGRHNGAAMSGLEQALWDLQGKALGIPCHDFFGGALRKRFRCYANINRSVEPARPGGMRSPEGFARMAAQAVRDGFDAIKLAPWDGAPKPGTAGFQGAVDAGVACAEAVRKAIGPGPDLLLDGHSHFDLKSGLELARRLEPLKLYWLEEVTPAEPVSDLAAINREAKMDTAGGESIYGTAEFAKYAAAGAVDILMPDVKYGGGMLNLHKAAHVAEGFGLRVAPHGPASPVGNCAAAHVCAAMPNFDILEYAYGEVGWRGSLVAPGEAMRGGYLELPPGPGLGIALEEETVRRNSV